MYAAVQRTIGILDEAGFPNWSIRAQKYWNCIRGPMVAGGGELWVYLWAGAADVGLGMALQAAFAVEGWSQAR